ncbi:LCP family protein [Intestinibacter sp.]|uniref:LCP family protein n=1 Tax=Intestinibacter sp. TaxID=1965304 RepID=UPI002A917549|nr:LCP family protein [Intestinibacter sp.]MDY5210982.1 LCP family protein [Intestinibacter sp.]
MFIRINSAHVDDNYKSQYQKVDGITNILLLGTDGREKEINYRSDAMMILTIDAIHSDIKLTSLARDTYVDIPEHGKGKLNAAYFWGKEDLLFETIEKNFKIGIDKFVQVDFEDLMNIVFVIGGVDVEIEERELESLNDGIPGAYNSCKYADKGEMQLINEAGKHTLNGYQAIAYARMRYLDNGIYRDERQRKIISGMFDGVKDLPMSEYPKLINTLLPYVKTNLTVKEMLNLAFTSYSFATSKEIKQAEYPIIDDKHVKGGKYKDAGWVWLYDVNSIGVLHDFIYEDINMEDNEYLKDDSKIELNY